MYAIRSYYAQNGTVAGKYDRGATAEDAMHSLNESRAGGTVGEIYVDDPRMTCRNVNVFYGAKQAIFDVNLDIGKNQVVAMIGPSGCGKSTFLRCLNRMNDTIDICRVSYNFV